jgi:cytoskeletal protein CcmA (bactofilin family)
MLLTRKKIGHETLPNNPPTIISKGMIIIGDMACKGDVKVDGHITGNVTSTGKIIIGPEGKIYGTIMASTIMVEGAIEGKIECAGVLSLKDKACVIGDVVFDTIEVDFGAELKGNFSKLEIQKIKHKIEENRKSYVNLKENRTKLHVIKNNSKEIRDSSDDEKEPDINEKLVWT